VTKFVKRLKAFTLIEILIVIAVSGLLGSAGFIAINPGKRMAQSRDTQRKHDLNLIAVGLEAYYNNLSSTTGTFYHYPDPGADLQSDSTEGANWIPGLAEGGHLKNIPKDPKQASLIRGNLASIFGQYFQKEQPKQQPQGNVAGLATFSFGTFANTGTTGFENTPKVGTGQICSPTVTYCAGYMLRQKWSRIEQTDDNYDWSYLDGALNTLKGAGKKAMIRISAGPYSPDFLRTQKNIPTWCWYDYVPNAPEGSSYNCFPWLLNNTYQAEIKELEVALYDHYHNSGTGHRQDLESAIAMVSILSPSHGKTPEFKVVQYPNNTIYQDPADGSGVPIGSYTETAPEVAQMTAFPASTFTAQGYTSTSMFAKLRDYITDATSAMPTWYITAMHGTKGPSPLTLVQNDYNHIVSSGYLSRVAMGFTWLMPNTALEFAQNQAIYDDIKQNFYEAYDGMIGWQYDPLGAPPADDLELEAWCSVAVPTGGKWGEAGEGRWPSTDLAAIAADPYCGQAPSPTPSPTPSPPPGVPPAPVLTSPVDGATGVSISPTLSWNASTGADTYRIHISLFSNFTPTVVNQGSLTSTSYNASGLLPNTTYWWRVRATNAAGDSTWSKRSFTTAGGSPGDTDGDGLSDVDETGTYGTDPNNPDTDGDVVNDGDEVSNGTNPYGPNNPSPSDFKYLYMVKDATFQEYTLWAVLENHDDVEIWLKPNAKCKEIPPANTSYNYCVTN